MTTKSSQDNGMRPGFLGLIFVIAVLALSLGTYIYSNAHAKKQMNETQSPATEVAQAATEVEQEPETDAPLSGVKLLSFTLSTNAVLGKPPVANANGGVQK